jgi:hypothetical protein
MKEETKNRRHGRGSGGTAHMRAKLALGMAMLGMLSLGCSLITTGTRNLLVETSRCVEDVCEARRNHQLAHDAWNEVRGANPGHSFSTEYEDGFYQGFLDYLDAGGSGEPPAFPPRKYWGVHYQTAAGYQAVQDWFTGFRHGATTARDSGVRQYIILPSSLPELQTGPAEPAPAPEATAPGAAAELDLPAPRRVLPH